MQADQNLWNFPKTPEEQKQVTYERQKASDDLHEQAQSLPNDLTVLGVVRRQLAAYDRICTAVFIELCNVRHTQQCTVNKS